MCGRELDIVKELAEAGSRNHGLVLELVRAGATIRSAPNPANC